MNLNFWVPFKYHLSLSSSKEKMSIKMLGIKKLKAEMYQDFLFYLKSITIN